ncbi:MAG: ADP-heptose synthase [Chthoniobacterales bacterium]|nr:MAG: ADP-heptose synthase [Chthoniobacterales bacterium]
MNKVLDLPALAEESRRLHAEGKRLVATNGCFDLLHVGHVRYLAAARRLGDALVVGVNGDASVGELKGAGRPLNNERDRAEVLTALEVVDYVAIFPQLRATEFLLAASPSVYVKGGDYTVESLNAEERGALEKCGSKIEIISFQPGYSTTGLLAKMCDG